MGRSSEQRALAVARAVNRAIDPIHGRAARFGSWFRANPVTGIALVGALLFSVRWLTYSFFYGRLDASPEDVGLGFSEALAQSAIAVTGWAVASAVTVVLLVVLGAVGLALLGTGLTAAMSVFWTLLATPLVFVFELLSRLVLKLARRPTPASWRGVGSATWDVLSENLRSTFRLVPGLAEFLRVIGERISLRRLAATIAVAVVLIVQLVLPLAAIYLSARVKDGDGVPRPELLGVPVLDLRAERAYVFWNSGKAPAPVDQRHRQCLMFLGSANGQTTLYDQRIGATIRLPASSVTIAVFKRQDCPGRQ